MIPEISNDPSWGFVSGRISALESHFFSKEFFLNIIAEDHQEDILPHLQETFLKDYVTPAAVWDDFGAVTDRCFYDMVMSIRADSPSPAPADMFLISGDYQNLKRALGGSTVFPFPFGLVSEENLEEIARGDITGVPGPIAEQATKELSDLTDISPVILDILLDGAYLRHLLLLADRLGSSFISYWVCEKVLASAVLVLWRAAKQGLPLRRYHRHFLPLGDVTALVDDLMAVEDLRSWPQSIGGVVGELMAQALGLDEDDQLAGFNLKTTDYMTRLAQDGKFQTAGPERVFAFLAGLAVEMQNLKLVVAGRLNRIGRDFLKLQLRETYV